MKEHRCGVLGKIQLLLYDNFLSQHTLWAFKSQQINARSKAVQIKLLLKLTPTQSFCEKPAA